MTGEPPRKESPKGTDMHAMTPEKSRTEQGQAVAKPHRGLPLDSSYVVQWARHRKALREEDQLAADLDSKGEQR